MIDAGSIIKKIVLTEKAADASAKGNKYTFQVAADANRVSVARAVETAFKVGVTKVNIINTPRKTRINRMNRSLSVDNGWKKAIVTLKDGDKIDLA